MNSLQYSLQEEKVVAHLEPKYSLCVLIVVVVRVFVYFWEYIVFVHVMLYPYVYVLQYLEPKSETDEPCTERMTSEPRLLPNDSEQPSRRVKDHLNSLRYSPRLKKACVRQAFV